jgi:hypothetical protein
MTGQRDNSVGVLVALRALADVGCGGECLFDRRLVVQDE